MSSNRVTIGGHRRVTVAGHVRIWELVGGLVTDYNRIAPTFKERSIAPTYKA